MSLAQLTLHEAAQGLRAGHFTSMELTEAVLERVASTDRRIRAYLALDPDSARTSARHADEKLREGNACDSPLLGIPIAVKDNILTRGLRTTCASKILSDFVPPFDASVVRRLRHAGAVLVGKTNLDEFAMGSSTENSAFFPTHNPWALDCVPGGSSGGSAAAVSAHECVAALGSDTGGSIRQPAAFCGIVGLKPTYGRVSRYGLVAFASSMDQIGPMTKDVRDAALLLEVIAGQDVADATSAPRPVPCYEQFLANDLQGVRVGFPKEYFIPGMEPRVEQAVRLALHELERCGATVKEISLPHTEYAIAVYYIVATAEASSNLARYDGMRYGCRADAPNLLETYYASRAEGFGAEVKRRIMLGTYALSAGYYEAYYLKAQRARALIKRDFDHAFQHCDLIVTPTAPSTAFKLCEKIDSPLQMYLSDVCTISANLAGLPALSVPCGFDERGLPIGMQILGRHFDEPGILRLANAYEQSTQWHKRKPIVESDDS